MASKDQHIAVDPNADNSDSSDYASGSEYSTASLTSSIYEYRYENGRRYHAYKDGAYVLPNDEKEQDRLDIIHHAYTLMSEGKFHLAPIGENPQKILDIGTGTGIWAIDVAERYPSAEVIGTDLSPIQPSWVPPNVQFQIDDAESTWTWREDTFDLIHIRHLSGAISDWKRLIRQAYRCAKPGGYIEIAEYDLRLYSDDGTLHKDTHLSKFYDLIHEAGRKNGRKFDGLEKTKTLIEDAGFENIHYRVVKLPIGTWPADPKEKEIGAYLLLNAETAFDAYGMALFTRGLGMSQEEAKRVVVGAEKDIRNRKIHSYSRHHLFYGRKPLQES